MGKVSQVFGIIFNILSFVFLFGSANPNDPFSGFQNWALSVLFALIAMLLYSIGAFKALKAGGSSIRFLITLAIFALCICIGGALNSTTIIVWNVAFALNLILQIVWTFRN